MRNSSHPLAPRHPSDHDGGMTPLDVPDHLVTAIDHVGIAVPDLDEAIAFYRDVYGMQVLHEETNEEQGVREAMVGVGDATPGSPCLQLLAPLSEDSTIAKFLDRSGPGLQQLAFRVTDVEQVAAVLRVARAPAPVRRAAARHVGQPGQLRPPQGRRRRAGRARGARPGRYDVASQPGCARGDRSVSSPHPTTTPVEE